MLPGYAPYTPSGHYKAFNPRLGGERALAWALLVTAWPPRRVNTPRAIAWLQHLRSSQQIVLSDDMLAPLAAKLALTSVQRTAGTP